ncbi:lysozyme inhibitor LprI family protein [Litoreibacter arenae]|uniref:Lysozyme inhibitor LprI-like N-terminal domain-containing protein n=1 Tax=Litoreibacter arenae DSM 19593 TaxID=1123360 RepID=S9QFD1_9RHOB|nr:lysozyme inhibitor LprI family protein [Litoreibacter arenae]EPX80111.1 hypothetical protein thalar_01449 [Litoreibacter arenae DSM 19593]
MKLVIGGAILATAFALALPAHAQQTLDRYTAVIGPQDRSNSSGVRLSQPDQILAQDRANVHRFGIRQPGDTLDRTFGTPEARRQIANLLARGTMGAGVAQALASGGMTALDVQIMGANGRAQSLHVTLAGSTAQPQVSGSAAAPQTGQMQWSYAIGDAGGATVASMNLQRDGALLATLRCMTSAAPAPVLGVDPRAGVVTIQFSPAITGPRVEGGRTAQLHLGTQPRLRQSLTFDPTIQIYAMSRTLTQRLSDDLERGARFSLTTSQSGTIHAPVPQDVGRAFAAACRARGVDASVSPGFDCARAGAAAEHTICAVPMLGALDRQLNAAYAGAPEGLKASQRAWIGARNDCGADVDCIARMTQQRIAMLSGGTLATIPLPGMAGASATTPAPAAATPNFAQMPQAAPTPTGGDVLVGNQALLDRFLLWTLGQNPQLAAEQVVQFRLRDFDFPPHFPEIGPTETTGAKAQARLEAAGQLYADRPPTRALLEQPMNIQRSAPDPASSLQLHGGFATQIGDLPAIVQIALQDRGAGALKGLQLNLEKPFYLPIPESFTPLAANMVRSNRGQSLALVDVTLSDHAPEFRGQRYYGGSAKATVHSVTLVYRPRSRGQNGQLVEGPDQVLHVWKGGNAPGADVASPSDPSTVAALYGGGVSNGRYMLNAYSLPTAFAQPSNPQFQGSSPAELLMTAMNLTAITSAQPDRTLHPELAQKIMRSLLTERERVEMFPLNIATPIHNNQPSEIEIRSAYAKNDQPMRDRVAARTPALPLNLRFASLVSLGEYDFATGGFPVSRVSQLGPLMPTTSEGRPVTESMPDFLPMEPDAAQALLDRLKRTGSGNARRLVLVVDYSLDALTPRPGGAGPISQQELGSVRPSFTVAAMGLYVEDDPAQPMFQIALPDTAQPQDAPVTPPSEGTPFTTGGSLPEDLFKTTARSLQGAADRLDNSGKILDDAMLNAYRVMPPTPQSTYEARKAALRAELQAEAHDSYWIGANIEMQPFDAERGGFPIKSLNFIPLSRSVERGAIAPPNLAPAEPEDYSLLRVPEGAVPVLQKMLGTQRYITAYLKVTPIDAIYDRRNSGSLLLSAPSEAIFGDGNGMPRAADLWLRVVAPKRIGTALDAAEVTPPEALMLDPEGIDLLALSLAPEAFNDAMFLRMLVDRLLKERSFAAQTDAQNDEVRAALPWRRFFSNPDQSLRTDAAQALLPEFKAWTLARAAALPSELLLPMGGAHPESGCRGLQSLSTPQMDATQPYFRADLPALLGSGQSLPDGARNFYSSGRPRPGPDQVWYWEGGGKNGGGMACQYVQRGLRGIDQGLRPDDADHVSAMVVVKAQPGVGQVKEFPDSYTYRLSVSDLKFVPASQLSKPAQGLAGMVVLKSEVEAAVGYRSGRFGRGAKVVARIEKGDWDLPTAKALKSADILKLTLEMPQQAFVKALRERNSDAAFYVTDVPGKGQFGHAVASHDPQTRESIVGIYADHVPDKPIMAIMRRMELDAANVSMEALKLSLMDKYGETMREDGEGTWFWGALPQEEDRWGYCGGPSLLRRKDVAQVPAMVTEDAAAFGDQNPISGNHYWGEMGWPSAPREQPGFAPPDISRCGTVVAVQVYENSGRLITVIWLFDRRVSQKLEAVPRPAPEKAKIEL